MVLAVAAELMTTVRLQGLLASLGCPAAFVEPEPAAVQEALRRQRAGVVVLDLSLRAQVRAAVFEAACEAGVPVIAFGPHADEAGLAEARRSGAAEVLTRGALAHGLGPLVAKHLARGTGIAEAGPS